MDASQKEALTRGRVTVVNGRGDLWGRFTLSSYYHAYVRLTELFGGAVPAGIRFLSAGKGSVSNAQEYCERAAKEFHWYRQDMGPHWEDFCSRWTFVDGRCTDDGGARATGNALDALLDRYPGARISQYYAIPPFQGTYQGPKSKKAPNLNIEAVKRIKLYPQRVREAHDYLYGEKPCGICPTHYDTLGVLTGETGWTLNPFPGTTPIENFTARMFAVDHYIPKAGNLLLQCMVFRCYLPLLSEILGAQREAELRGSLSQLIVPENVEAIYITNYERIGTGCRTDYPGPVIDTGPHQSASHHISRYPLFCDTVPFYESFDRCLAHNTVFKADESVQRQQSQLVNDLNLEGCYFAREHQGSLMADSHWIKFTPPKGGWMGVQAHWQLVKSSHDKSTRTTYRMKPRWAWVDAVRVQLEDEAHVFLIETEVSGVGRSFGYRYERTLVYPNGRREKKVDEWTVPCPAAIGNGYRHVAWEQMTGSPNYMLSLEAQRHMMSFCMAAEDRLQGCLRTDSDSVLIPYTAGTNALRLIDDGRPEREGRQRLRNLTLEADETLPERFDRTYGDEEEFSGAESAAL
ncbi:MAG: hypothetical protein KDD69_09000 [Bdellovibrionales bacterium]|nr:hypothetical protein [Bdellovibrionales bacterium]